jgi:hypothetical protein
MRCRAAYRGGGATGRTDQLVSGNSITAWGVPTIGDIGFGATGASAPTTQHTAQSAIMAPWLSGQASHDLAQALVIADAGRAVIGDTANANASMVMIPTHRNVINRNQRRIIVTGYPLLTRQSIYAFNTEFVTHGPRRECPEILLPTRVARPSSRPPFSPNCDRAWRGGHSSPACPRCAPENPSKAR